MDQLSPQDSQFLYLESRDNHIHVTSIAIFDPSTAPNGRVRFKEVMEHVRSRLHTSPVFRRRLVRVPLELDFPYWVDDENFDIEYHVTHARLPAPGDWRQFCIHMARYHSRPLNMSRPLWEMYVCEGLDAIDWLPKGAYAIATKIHHAAVDGMSLVRFFGALADIDNKGTPALKLDTTEASSSPRPGIIDMGSRAIWNAVRSPIGLTDAIMRAAPSLYRLAQDALSSQHEQDDEVPDTRFNCKISPHKMFDATAFRLDDLREMRSAVSGSTVNDVVLCICGGALRRYLIEHNELPEESLIAWVPINARPAVRDDGNAGNNITSMTTRIHTDIADPIERLQAIQEETSESKAARSGISARLMTDLSQHVPSATLVGASRLVLHTGVAARMCNLFISNVPGPQVPMYMCGAQQLHMYGMAPLADGMGLFIATPSFNGEITFNVISTRETLPDIRFFIECLEASVDELKQAVEAAPKRQKKKKKRA